MMPIPYASLLGTSLLPTYVSSGFWGLCCINSTHLEGSECFLFPMDILFCIPSLFNQLKMDQSNLCYLQHDVSSLTLMGQLLYWDLMSENRSARELSSVQALCRLRQRTLHQVHPGICQRKFALHTCFMTYCDIYHLEAIFRAHF